MTTLPVESANTKEAPVKLPVTTTPDEIAKLRGQLEETQAAFVSAVMEKNFLQRAMADLNFHHNAHDGIIFTDKENRIVYANPYFLKMMKIENPAELLNKPFPPYMWSKPDDETQLFHDVREDGFVRERELNLYNQQRQPIFVACSSVASKDDEGNFVGTEIMLCNVTTKHRIQGELTERTAELERMKDFWRSSLKTLTDSVQSGASKDEILASLKQIETALDKKL